ncbi:MFS transporter [Fusibacter ferrireducens]|uniref:MFS transporter n=1 Tax=Fusibacter ferrireducens TaxID=2785058 RepID=A0ABR9ZWZ8_9FIRM|nr:MFS transporter [Fusibacter ferrireducens]MBF4694987.1 MFS transporter [Fusibacter ferrireducens]
MLSILSKNKDSRNLILFITGKGFSVFGSSIYAFAISLYVLKMTGSALNFATSILLGIVPMIIFAPFAGILTDRFSKKGLIVFTDTLNGLLFLTLYTVSANSPLSLEIIYFTTVLLSLFSTLFMVSMEAAKPALVSAEKLLKINTLSKIIDSLSAILGPILGGIAFAIFDMRFFLLINAVSFLFSACTEMFFKFNTCLNFEKNKPKTSLWIELKEGIYYLNASREIKKFTSVFIFINFFLGFALQVPLPYIVNNVLMLSPRWYGMINGAFPVGLIAGALIVEKIMSRFNYDKILLNMVWIMAACSITVGVPLLISWPKEWIGILYLLIMFILGITIALIDIPIAYILQDILPEYIRGRILSLVASVVKIFLPLGLFLSGILIQSISVYYLPILGGVLALLYSCIFHYFANNKKAACPASEK